MCLAHTTHTHPFLIASRRTLYRPSLPLPLIDPLPLSSLASNDPAALHPPSHLHLSLNNRSTDCAFRIITTQIKASSVLRKFLLQRPLKNEKDIKLMYSNRLPSFRYKLRPPTFRSGIHLHICVPGAGPSSPRVPSEDTDPCGTALDPQNILLTPIPVKKLPHKKMIPPAPHTKWRLAKFPVRGRKTGSRWQGHLKRRRPHETAIVTSHRHRFLLQGNENSKKKGIFERKTIRGLPRRGGLSGQQVLVG
ncbi:hypothetical protein JTE90_026044 [Oedothorax gibbosus]|uniref:Uncharacterized protein n=1 Tax=Oedothorax gibbosus TaxID=931172 RepID=A0AAV6UDS2_9ARAC|nr:hypothetical protein JTE90_026044 [Oedothorax gibbosus]